MFQLVEKLMIEDRTIQNRQFIINMKRKKISTIVDISAFCRDSIEFNRLYIAISFAIISL